MSDELSMEPPVGGDLPSPHGGGGPEPESAQTYEQAAERLEAIIARLDSGQVELRETLELVKEGKRLVELCKGELDAVSGELEQLDLDALVEALDAAG